MSGFHVRHLTARHKGGPGYTVFDARGAQVSAVHHDMDRAQAIADGKNRRVRVKARACMTCAEAFESEGPHHRMCKRCRSAHDESAPAAVHR